MIKQIVVVAFTLLVAFLLPRGGSAQLAAVRGATARNAMAADTTARNATARNATARNAIATDATAQDATARAGTWAGAAPVTLAQLVAEARAGNPGIQAARRMADAAESRISQAGALPDPMLLLGVMNIPAATLNPGSEDMTMGAVQLGQRLPARGTRSAREAVARESLQSEISKAEELEMGVITRLKSAYYELLFVDAALALLARNRMLLVDLSDVTGVRLAVDQASQQDVLRAQTEITRMDEQLSALHARRAGSTAEINAILQRPMASPIVPVYPEAVRKLALAPATRTAFTVAALDGGLGDGFPSLADLQLRAGRERPMLEAHLHATAASRARVTLAERELVPDIDVMLGYGARLDRPDLLSASISVPLPLFAARKQRQAVAEAAHLLAANEFQHHDMVASIEADVTARYAALIRTREQILLLSDGVIPQSRAALESAASSYQGGRSEFMTLLDAQAMLFRNEIELARQLANFGGELAELERAVGMELTMEEAS